MKKQRKHYAPEEKVAILRRHLLDKEPISKLCDELGLLSKWNGKPSKKGTGFEQPLAAHQHWHIDVSYINVSGTFYYLCSILDACSRYIVNWDLRESMTTRTSRLSCRQRGRSTRRRDPGSSPTTVRSSSPGDFKEFIRISGMTHVRTSPYYPQSNGKIQRWHKSLKGECIRPGTPLSLEDARRLVEGYVNHYNNVRLNSAVATSRHRTCSPGVSKRSMPKGTGSEARKQRQVRRQKAAKNDERKRSDSRVKWITSG
jgi:transposase InsO family protein